MVISRLEKSRPIFAFAFSMPVIAQNALSLNIPWQLESRVMKHANMDDRD